MDRVGGWYKRKSQWVIAAISLVVTVAMNVDSLLIMQHLSTQSALRDAMVAQAKSIADEGMPADAGSIDAQVRKLNLPIGWYHRESTGDQAAAAFRSTNRLLLDRAEWADILGFHIVGWLLTAIAASLGAPFWFDTLNKIMSIRAAGKAPEERPREPKEVPVPLEPGQSPRQADAATSQR